MAVGVHLVAMLAAGTLGCGGAKSRTAAGADLEGFVCNDRRVEYAVVGGFVAAEAGITVDCINDNPKLSRWRVDGDSGERTDITHRLGGGQFEDLWTKIDSSGWRFLEQDCDNPEAADDDPVYSIEIGDHATSVTLTCSGKELIFPYNRIINELDLLSAGLGDGDN